MAVYQEKDKNRWTKDGRKWYYMLYYIDAYGNKKRKKSKLFATKESAKDAESEFRIKVKIQDENDINIQFETVLLEWLQYKKQLVKFTTYYKIEKGLKKHILPYFKPYKLHAIKANILLTWKEIKKAEGILNPESLNKIIGYFQELLEYSRINYNFNIKVASKLQKDKVPKKKNRINDAEWNFWTYEEFNQFITGVTNRTDYFMYNFLYYTGVRMGEMAGIRWENIDLDKKIIKIVDNLTRSEDGGFETTDPKTNNSIRIVDLDDELVKLLKEHYNHEKNIYGFNNHFFVFGNVKYLSFTTFRNHLNKYIANMNIKRITPHGFRHSHVSLLIYLGCDSREVAERIGDTVEMVEKTYYHMFPEKKKHTVNVLNDLRKQYVIST